MKLTLLLTFVAVTACVVCSLYAAPQDDDNEDLQAQLQSLLAEKEEDYGKLQEKTAKKAQWWGSLGLYRIKHRK